jgi:hypothetical protein
MLETQERGTTNWRMQSRVQLALGVIGVGYAFVLMYPKAVRLLAGDSSVLGRGAIANVALLLGSLMFLRNWKFFRAQSRKASAGSDHESRVTGHE